MRPQLVSDPLELVSVERGLSAREQHALLETDMGGKLFEALAALRSRRGSKRSSARVALAAQGSGPPRTA
jgi:hypothetical protein